MQNYDLDPSHPLKCKFLIFFCKKYYGKAKENKLEFGPFKVGGVRIRRGFGAQPILIGFLLLLFKGRVEIE